VRRLLAPAIWWIVLFWLWLLLVGEWNREQLVAAAIAATLGTAAAETVRRRAGLTPSVGLPVLARCWTLPWEVLADFGVVAWALVRSLARRPRVRGSFHVRRSEPEDPAWVT
jgi:hypothetical protein